MHERMATNNVHHTRDHAAADTPRARLLAIYAMDKSVCAIAAEPQSKVDLSIRRFVCRFYGAICIRGYWKYYSLSHDDLGHRIAAAHQSRRSGHVARRSRAQRSGNGDEMMVTMVTAGGSRS